MRDRRRRKNARNCKAPLESFQPQKLDSEFDHFRRLARVQGVEAAVNCYTRDELLKIMRVNNFTYINPRARKIDLAHAITAPL